MRRVTVRQLQIFASVAETLSLARVAENLRLTPSAISFQIKQIESQSGFALFERIGRRVALTDAGAVLLGYARVVLRSLQEADEAMTVLQGATGGRVKLGLVSTAKYLVPHMIARFRAVAPGVTVLLREGNRGRILALLTDGSIDLAIMGQPPVEADVIARRFAAHPSVVVAHPAHRLRGAALLEPSALAGEWFISREEGSGTRLLADNFFQQAGFRPRIAMETSSNEMIKQAVIAGMGIALISGHTIVLESALELLVPLPLANFPLMRAWFVVQRRTLPLLPAQSRLADFLLAEGQTIIDDIARLHAARAAFQPMPHGLHDAA